MTANGSLVTFELFVPNCLSPTPHGKQQKQGLGAQVSYHLVTCSNSNIILSMSSQPNRPKRVMPH